MLVKALGVNYLPSGIREKHEVFEATDDDLRHGGNSLQPVTPEEAEEYHAKKRAGVRNRSMEGHGFNRRL